MARIEIELRETRDDGSVDTRRVTFTQARVQMGRSETADVVFGEEGVSRVHLVLEQEDGAWYATHEGRFTQTLADGRGLAHGQRVAIGDGSVLAVGRAEFRIRTSGVVTGRTAPRPEMSDEELERRSRETIQSLPLPDTTEVALSSIHAEPPTLEEALAFLGLARGAGASQVQDAYSSRRTEIVARMAGAGTEVMRAKHRHELEVRLPAARDAALAGASASRVAGRAATSSSSPRSATAPPAATPAPAVAGPVREGDVLGDRFELRRRLGAGGMGVVFEAYDRTRGEAVALKVMLPGLVEGGEARERLLGEARVASQLSHPNIVKVHDLHRHGELVFISMELLQGRTLRDEMDAYAARKEPFPADRAIRIASQLCAALQHAHATTVHRDVKPENVWIQEDGSVKLMDFGIARAMSSRQLTVTGVGMGTAFYMAPEQMRDAASVTPAADQYSAAVVVYEMLTGQLPAGRAKRVSEMRRDVTKTLSAAVDRGLAQLPEHRFPTTAQFSDALRAPVRLRSSPLVKWGVAAAVLAAIATAVTILWGAGIAHWVREQTQDKRLVFTSEQKLAELRARLSPDAPAPASFRRNAAVAALDQELRAADDLLADARPEGASKKLEDAKRALQAEDDRARGLSETAARADRLGDEAAKLRGEVEGDRDEIQERWTQLDKAISAEGWGDPVLSTDAAAAVAEVAQAAQALLDRLATVPEKAAHAAIDLRSRDDARMDAGAAETADLVRLLDDVSRARRPGGALADRAVHASAVVARAEAAEQARQKEFEPKATAAKSAAQERRKLLDETLRALGTEREGAGRTARTAPAAPNVRELERFEEGNVSRFQEAMLQQAQEQYEARRAAFLADADKAEKTAEDNARRGTFKMSMRQWMRTEACLAACQCELSAASVSAALAAQGAQPPEDVRRALEGADGAKQSLASPDAEMALAVLGDASSVLAPVAAQSRAGALDWKRKAETALRCRKCAAQRGRCATCTGNGQITITCPACTGSTKVPENCDDCRAQGRRGCQDCGTKGQITEQCPQCRGAATLQCTNCRGAGTVNCTGCSGRRTFTCGACSGSGTTKIMGYTIPCLACEADGQIDCKPCKAQGQLTCGTCGGSRNVDCPACNGGQVVVACRKCPQSAGWFQCERCRGRKTVDRRCTDCRGGKQQPVCPECDGQKECPACGGDGRAE